MFSPVKKNKSPNSAVCRHGLSRVVRTFKMLCPFCLRYRYRISR